MANVRLLRQSLYDHDKKIAAINRDYTERYNEYYDKTMAYNAAVSANPYVNHGAAPVSPTMPDRPHNPSLRESDYKEMSAPGTDQAGIAIANAKGYTGKSDVEALNDQASRFTAQQNPFADPNDPYNLKERGVLARTLGGQLG